MCTKTCMLQDAVLQPLLNLLQITSFSTRGTELVGRKFQLSVRADAVDIKVDIKQQATT